MFIQRIMQLGRRKRAAARLGIRFDRAASFVLPEEVMINGELRRLALPAEHGVKMAFIDLLLDDCYGCRKISGPVKTILDIGANVGLFGLMARHIFSDAIIHAYEPNPELEPYLQVQAEAGSFDYFVAAVGPENGKVSLHTNNESVLSRSEINEDGNIRQIAFRDAIARLGGSVDLLKMDCEGAEWELFQDVASWRCVQHLSMEYHLWPDHTVAEVLDKVRELGFQVEHHIPMDGFGLLVASRGIGACRADKSSYSKS